MKPRNFPVRRKLRQLRAVLRRRELLLTDREFEILQMPHDMRHRRGAAAWRELYY